MNHIFICHSSKDYLTANRIVEKFEKKQFECWIAPRNLSPGSNHLRELPAAIESCDYFLLLISENVYTSWWVELELLHAITCRKYIIPLVIDDLAVYGAFAFGLQNTQIRYAKGNLDAAITEIADFIKTDSQGMPADIRELTSQQCYERAQNCSNSCDAVKWYRVAANRGHALAQKKLADHYLLGKGVPVNMDLSFHWYQKAAQSGLSDALYSLAVCYDFGYGTDQKPEQAAVYYLCAAECGHADAQYCIGTMYESGEGVRQDQSEAMKWYQKAADQGDREARDKLLQSAA